MIKNFKISLIRSRSKLCVWSSRCFQTRTTPNDYKNPQWR